MIIFQKNNYFMIGNKNCLNNEEENKNKKRKTRLSKLYKWIIPRFKHFIGMS
jgi:hypothetical protein